MKNFERLCLVGFIVFAAAGVTFSAISTYDFVVHLDRQVHSISCSFIPGGERDTTGTSGCYAVMMSRYSSVLRDKTWGGIPIALASLGVFAYLLFLGVDFLFRKLHGRPLEMLYVVAASCLPLLSSLVYFFISMVELGTVCKVCIGIYVASAGVFVFALLAHACARKGADTEKPQPVPWLRWSMSFVEGVAFVAVPVALFLVLKPAYTEEMSRCGELLHSEDKYGVRVDLGGNAGGAPALELVDPLCPACRAFRDRLKSSGYGEKLNLQAVLFPLDKSCNWMVTESLHPGACAVAEAVLCAGDGGAKVLNWALDNQEELRAAAQSRADAVYDKIKNAFPNVSACVGKPAVRSRINKSLRWIVSNSVPVMVPQLFIGGRKLCSEDLDLGLEMAMGRALGGAR